MFQFRYLIFFFFYNNLKSVVNKPNKIIEMFGARHLGGGLIPVNHPLGLPCSIHMELFVHRFKVYSNIIKKYNLRKDIVRNSYLID